MTTDARVARSRAAVVRAATDLLVDGGPASVTVDAIVARSGVAKSTIYRHWDSRDDILVDVIASCAPTLTEPAPELGFLEAINDLLTQISVTLADPEWTRVFPALLTLKIHEDGLANIEQQLEDRQERVLDSVRRRGIEEGSISATIGLNRAGAMLGGPRLFANLIGKPTLDPAFTAHVVQSFLVTEGTRPDQD